MKSKIGRILPMKIFEAPEFELVKFNVEDVITESGEPEADEEGLPIL